LRLPLSIRKALAPLAATIPVRIKAGPNSGCRWSLSAAGRHRAGNFEADRIKAILALIRPGDCLWDIGAHHGYVSLAASRKVGTAGYVYSFEPSEFNFPYLRRHVQWNERKNITPLNLGVARKPGKLQFGGSGSSQSFRIGGGSSVIEVTSLRSLLDSNYRRPDLIKIDAEGAESEILSEGVRYIPSTTAVVLSLHSQDNYRVCMSALSAASFTIFESEDVRLLKSEEGEWGHDPDVIAVGSGREDLMQVAGRLPGFGRA
jgi:FkbM family methyltransferase